ncbi:MAG: LysR family transcriptional regulator [Acetobacter sp.]|jgi:DNA-binding transcriptional LysR family regulator|nr:LysR family transcriptional regulator [Acetobacter sp.]MCI1292589.1 LysR family transcriptional regulator [Acetobacter sp.]MCI1319311.1 LysR family transcriptional regulator [Acetobacter sp.]MCI1372637.1 LysR family transcriptional regulator [Acetobacter sp.]MCI1412468.1 LysR family transcriptional regulator [Acetobacter sp.]
MMITELRTFLVAAQLESFAATAEKVGLTQSAVSAQIKRLELEFGYALFERTGRAVSLSQAGVIAVDRAVEIVAMFDRMRDIPRDTTISGTIKVGVISTAYAALLAPAMAEFLKIYADVLLSVSVDVSLALLQKLEAKALDMAIMVKPPFSLIPNMEWVPLVTQRYVLVSHETVEIQDWKTILNQNPFIRYDSRSFGGSSISSFLKMHSMTPHDITETEEISLILEMVSKKIGVAIIPACQEIDKYNNIKCTEIPEFSQKREIGVMAFNSKKKASVGKFISFLSDKCA